MSSKDQNLSKVNSDKLPDGKEWKIAIAVSEWNSDITERLSEACIQTLKDNGVQEDNLHVVNTPGSFELTFAAKALIKNIIPDAVICLGCVIKGETQHDEYINNAVAQGLTQLGMVSNIPVIFGVLTVNNMAQALDRAGGQHGNKGTECAHTALKMIALNKSFTKTKKSIGFD